MALVGLGRKEGGEAFSEGRIGEREEEGFVGPVSFTTGLPIPSSDQQPAGDSRGVNDG